MSEFITPHFRWSEFLDSEKAQSLGIDNIPGDYEKANIVQTARILERVRSGFHQPLVINSGYRCKTLNDALEESSPNSYHLDGRAVDIHSEHLTDRELSELLTLLECEDPVELYYTRTYIHVAY